jgi:hypothetical protein
MSDSDGSDEGVDAFAVMRQGAEDQVGVRLPWGQRNKKKGMDRLRCRSEQLVEQRPPPSDQTRLLAHRIRPERWSAAPFVLDEDILQLVAEALMDYIGGDCDLRALAVTSRACAKGVRTALDMVRKRLNALRLDYLQAEANVRQVYREFTADSAEGLEADLERNEAKRNFLSLMHRRGIPQPRTNSIVFNAERLSFHDNRSLLGHIADGCELCGAREAGRPYHGTNIALHACRACRNRDRVRLDVAWPPDEHGRVKITIPKAATVGNTYASALLSRRAAHRRRMTATRASANRPIKLSKRVHYFECTPVLECLVMSWIHLYCQHVEAGMPIQAHIELWHALPVGFENCTFASVMDVCEHGDDRARAAHHQAQCRARRLELARMGREYEKLLKNSAVLVAQVNEMLDDPQLTDWGSWHLAMDVCCAAQAFEMRWVFAPRIRFTPGRDWLGNRYGVLKIPEGERKRMLNRIDILLSALNLAQRDYTRERNNAVHEHGPHLRLEDFSAGRDRGRKCYLEIAKRMPVAWLTTLDSWVIFQALRNLRRTHMHFVLEDPPLLSRVSHQTLTITIQVDQRFFDGLHGITLSCSIGKYSCSQIGKLASMPEIERLTPAIVAKLSSLANMRPDALTPLPDNPLRDQARTVLFGLPGAHLKTARKITLTRPN